MSLVARAIAFDSVAHCSSYIFKQPTVDNSVCAPHFNRYVNGAVVSVIMWTSNGIVYYRTDAVVRFLLHVFQSFCFDLLSRQHFYSAFPHKPELNVGFTFTWPVHSSETIQDPAQRHRFYLKRKIARFFLIRHVSSVLIKSTKIIFNEFLHPWQSSHQPDITCITIGIINNRFSYF